jgi:glycine betaine/proline transport system substrate-binding protein
MKKMLLTMALASFFNVASANENECGKISMAGLPWGSASILGEIDKRVLEKGYGCAVEVIPGGTVPSFTSIIERGTPNIMGELWPNAAGIDSYNNALDRGSIVEATANSPIGGVEEGWFVLPNILEKHPELTTVEAVLARPDLFPHPDDPSKGAFVTCPPGSGCQISNSNLFVAFDMRKRGWRMVSPGSYPAQASTIARAYDRDIYWFGYSSAPTAVNGKYNLKKLDWGVDFAGLENWNCITKPNCSDPKPSAWTESFVRTIFTKEFSDRNLSNVKDYFKKRVIPGDVMNKLLAYMDENQASPAEVAELFFNEYSIWQEWVNESALINLK